MIEVVLGESSVSRTRIAPSPMAELVAALQLLHRGADAAPWPYRAWADRARSVAADPNLAPIRVYGQLYGAHHGRRTPDFVEPFTDLPEPTLAQELQVLRDTSQDEVDRQLDQHYPEGLPAFLVPFRRDRRRALAELAGALQTFWHEAIAMHWPAMRTALSEEIVLRSRVLAASGPEALIGSLVGSTGLRSWSAPVLALDKPVRSRLDAAGRRLVLTPVIFADGRSFVSTDQPDVVRLTYQSRGSGVLTGTNGDGPVRERRDRLSEVVGPRRAALIRALEVPSTTSTLAATLGLPPSTVSEHLTALHAVGVLSRIRHGRRVLYGLDADGVALLRLLG